jgi:hypothetical protein
MDDRLDRLEKMIAEAAEVGRATLTKVEINSRQIAGVSKRIDSLAQSQKRFGENVSKRLDKVEGKAQITIEGHEAIRSEMRREFATLRRDLDLRVQPIELAVKKGRAVSRR